MPFYPTLTGSKSTSYDDEPIVERQKIYSVFSLLAHIDIVNNIER